MNSFLTKYEVNLASDFMTTQYLKSAVRESETIFKEFFNSLSPQYIYIYIYIYILYIYIVQIDGDSNSVKSS